MAVSHESQVPHSHVDDYQWHAFGQCCAFAGCHGVVGSALQHQPSKALQIGRSNCVQLHYNSAKFIYG